MDKLKYIKLENEDGSYSESIPLSVNSEWVDVDGKTLTEELKNKAEKKELNEKTTKLENEIKGLVSGSPLVASSIIDMVDINRIYVNTTDGKWYYYNGSLWTIGGTYQATEIGEDTVKYDNLNLDLKNKTNIKFLDKKYDFVKFGWLLMDNTHLLQKTQHSDYYCLQVPTDEKYLLRIKREYFGDSTSYLSTYCSGEDSDNYEIKNLKSAWNNNSALVMLYNPYDLDYYYFLIQENEYPYWFINLKYDIKNVNFDDINVYKYSDLLNEENLKLISNNFSGIVDYDKKNLYKNNLQLKGYPYWAGSTYPVGTLNGNITNSTISSFYYLKAGEECFVYTKSSGNYIVVYDSNLDKETIIKITDGEHIIFNNNVYYKKKLSYVSDKFIIAIDTLGSSKYNIIISKEEISIPNIDKIEGIQINNNIPIKNWYAFGDSITNKNMRALVNYIDWTCKDINIINHNYAVSAMGYKKGNNNFTQQLSNLTEYNPTTDIITVMGSINDLTYVSDSLGQLGDTTMDTVYGSMYTFFNTLFTMYTGARVGIISPIVSIATHNNQVSKQNMLLYIQALKDTAELFNIPFINIFDCGNLRPWESDFLNEYYIQDGEGGTGQIDSTGVHPNSKGHQLFYGRIREFIKTL